MADVYSQCHKSDNKSLMIGNKNPRSDCRQNKQQKQNEAHLK